MVVLYIRVVANSTKLTALEDSSGSGSDSDDCNEGEESDSEPEHELDSNSDSDEDELDGCGQSVCMQEDGGLTRPSCIALASIR